MKLLPEYEIRQRKKPTIYIWEKCALHSVQLSIKCKNGTEWQTIQFPFFFYFFVVVGVRKIVIVRRHVYTRPSTQYDVSASVYIDTHSVDAIKTSITYETRKKEKNQGKNPQTSTVGECCNTLKKSKASLSNRTHSCNKNYYPLNGIRLR